MRPIFIFGAGAVGSALGAYLARTGHPVTLLARENHARRIQAQQGVRVRSRGEVFLAPVEAVTHPPATLPAEGWIFITVKAQDAAAAAAALGELPRHHPVVTWQNGIRAEADAAPHCPRLYGGVVRFTATMLEPGEVRLRAPGSLIVGRHPRGSDQAAAALVEDLNRAGFTAAQSPEIAADKALKLFVNLVSGPPVLVRRTGRDPALAKVQLALLLEADAVFRAANIPVYPASGIGQEVPDLLQRFREGGSAPDTRGGVYNSTWQSLHYTHRSLENAYYHGEVISLGERHGVATPVNRRALEVLQDVHRQKLGPEPFSPAEFRARFAGVVDFSEASETPAPEAGDDARDNLEI